MGNLHISTKQEIKGPWLLTKEDFQSLENVISSVFEKLKNIDSSLSISISLKSKNQDKLTDKSIHGILSDPKVKDFKPKELTIQIGSPFAKNSFSFNISTSVDGSLDYLLLCDVEEIKYDIMYEIENWIDKNKPKKVYQFWSNIASFFIYFLGGVWCFILLLNLFSSPSDSYKIFLKNKSDSLIRQGINDNNQKEAIDILLKLQTNYIPEDNKFQTSLNNGILKILIISIIIIIMLGISPKTTLGISKYKWKVTFYKFWIKCVLVTVPCALFLPKIIDLFWDFLK